MSSGAQPPRSHCLCSQRRKQKPTFSIKRSSCLSNTNWLQEKLCCTRHIRYNWISDISKPVRKMESENATSDRNMQRSGLWLYSAYIYIYSPPPLIIQFYFLLSGLWVWANFRSDFTCRPTRWSKEQFWEKHRPSVPVLHIYSSVLVWINFYYSCNPAFEFTSLLLNPQGGSGELHAWHSVSMHSMWRCFRSRDYWKNTPDGRCIQTTQFNLARHSD